MNKKIVFISISVLFAITIFLAGRYIYNLFSPSQGVVINSTKINEIKNIIIRDTIVDYDNLKIGSFEGSNRFVSLKFQNGNNISPLQDYYLIYDAKSGFATKEIKDGKYIVNLIDAAVVKYIGNNEFIIISSKGDIYKYSPNNSISKLLYIGSSSVRGDNVFKSTYYNDNVYILTRAELNNYNEKSYNESSVIQIKCENTKHTKFSIKEYPLDKDDYAFSFVYDTNGGIGVLRSSTIDIATSFVEGYKSEYYKTHASLLPVSQEKIRFINTNDVSVIFFSENNRKVKIDRQSLKLDTDNIINDVNKKYSLNIGYPSNVPIFLATDKSIFTKATYEDMLLNKNFSRSAPAIYHDVNSFKSGAELKVDIYFTTNFKFRDYVVFAQTNIGYIGIKKDGSYDKISNASKIFIYNTTLLYENNKDILFSSIK